MMITYHFKPWASLLGAIIAASLSILLVLIFPSLKQTWLLRSFWGGLSALGMFSAAIASFAALAIGNNLSRMTAEVAGVSAGYTISLLFLRSDLSLLGWFLATIAYAFPAYFVYHVFCDAIGTPPD